MKTMMRIVAVMLIAVMCLTGAALAEGQIRTEAQVNVRKGPSLDYASMGTVKAGRVYKFDRTEKDERGVIWYHATNGSGWGWISSKFTTQLSGSVSNNTGAKTKGSTVKASGNANLRKGPGLDYAEVGLLKKGQTAKYQGETKKDERGVAWYKVSVNGKTGWVSSRYGKLTK